MSPHAERRLESPLRGLAKKAPDWRGLSSAELAEHYAEQRKFEEKMAAADRATRQTPEEEGRLGWFGRLLRLLRLA
jgi:hypothetical protein